MKGRRLEKLTEHFMSPYKIKNIISTNVVELVLPSTVQIHLVIDISKIQLYNKQVEEQKKVSPPLVIIEGEEEFEVEKILNKIKVQRKERYLVWWKEYTVEADIYEGEENLENAKEVIKEFRREYWQNKEVIRYQEREEDKEEGVWSRDLLGEYMVKMLFGWEDKEYKRKKWRGIEKIEKGWQFHNEEPWRGGHVMSCPSYLKGKISPMLSIN